MTARMTNMAYLLPESLKGIRHILKAISDGGLSDELLEIVGMRASQINGCAACLHAHAANLRKAGVSEEKIATVASWRHAPFFTDAEVTALKLTETVTRLADRSDESVPDELWDEVVEHFDEKGVATLILQIALLNFFNRINTTIREPAGTTW